MFLTAAIYTCNLVKLAVYISPSTLLRFLQEAGYRGNGPKKIRVMSKYVCMTSYPYFIYDL